MKLTPTVLAHAFIPLCLALFGCGVPSGGGGNATDASASADAEATADASVEQAPDMAPPNFETCQFDLNQQGNTVGRHIADFTLDQWDGTPFSFHENCGGGVKAVWIFLSTGWCGACERYADSAERFYQAFADQGLRIVWIVGEDAAGNAPTPEYMREYYEQKNVTFTVLRDDMFAQTQQFLDATAAGNALPRQFILDGRTMEMLFADSGVGAGAESLVHCTSTKPMTLEQCMNRGQ